MHCVAFGFACLSVATDSPSLPHAEEGMQILQVDNHNESIHLYAIALEAVI